MNNPAAWLEPPARERCYSDSDLLDFLDEMKGTERRVIFERQRFFYWELRSTTNRLNGFISTRDAITDMARRMQWEPRAERRGWWARVAAWVGA